MNIKKIKKPKIKSSLSVSIVFSKCGHEYEKIFKEEESTEILKILGLIKI